MDLLRLGLEPGKCAYEAMQVIIDLLQEYGQCGDCEYEEEWGNANYHNSLLIADPHAAWVLETAGRYWAAKKITRGAFSISNIYTIENDWDLAHPDLVQHAIEQGWTQRAEDFNFARDYGDYWRKGSKNPRAIQIRRNETLRCLQKDYGKISPMTMMQINRNHHEGTIVAPRWGAAEAFWASPCMHDTAHSSYRSAASIVAHLRAQMPPLLRQTYWASFANPCCNVFQPFYMKGPKIPSSYALGSSTYSTSSPWWSANRVKLLCDLNNRALNPAVRSIFDLTEGREQQRQRSFEAEVVQLTREGKESASVDRLQKFVDENCRCIENEYRMLNTILPTMLESVGIEYVYKDYPKGWSSKKGVPLPWK